MIHKINLGGVRRVVAQKILGNTTTTAQRSGSLLHPSSLAYFKPIPKPLSI